MERIDNAIALEYVADGVIVCACGSVWLVSPLASHSVAKQGVFLRIHYIRQILQIERIDNAIA